MRFRIFSAWLILVASSVFLALGAWLRSCGFRVAPPSVTRDLAEVLQRAMLLRRRRGAGGKGRRR